MNYIAHHFTEKEIADLIDKDLLSLPADLLKIHLSIIKNGVHHTPFSTDDIADRLGTTNKKVQQVIDLYLSDGKIELKKEQVIEEYHDENLELCIYYYSLFHGREAEISEVADIQKICNQYHIDYDYFSYIVDYCLSKNKLSTSYLKAVTKDWIKRGLTTREMASSYFTNVSAKIIAVKKGFGLNNRNLAPVEIAYIESWNHNEELIQYACEKALLYTGKPNFRYANSILNSWKEKGIDSLDKAKEDVLPKETESPHKNFNAFHNFDQRVYDYDSLEKLLIEKYHNPFS